MMLSRPAARLTLSEAIDRSGPILYGADWIGRCSDKEIQVLKKYGPAPFNKPTQSIKPCPAPHVVALDRAIGKDRRMVLQRATVLDWLRAARVMTDPEHCDPVALDKKLERSKRQKNPVGAPRMKQELVARQMRDQLQSQQITLSQLRAMKQETLEKMFGASRKACVPARKTVVSEFGTI